MRTVYVACACAFLAGTAYLGCRYSAPSRTTTTSKSSPSALIQDTEPGGTKADSDLAQSNPDEYAWRLFFFMARQAEKGAAGIPDPSKPTILQDEGGAALVWETWALASGNFHTSEVFLCPAKQPSEWDELPRPKDAFPQLTLAENLTASTKGPHRPFIPPLGQENNLEIRINKKSFDTIRTTNLWDIEDILQMAASAKSDGRSSFADFPEGSKEVKATWVELKDCEGANGASCEEKKHYHWRTVDSGPNTEIWGLAALHVTTKEIDMPNWFWADFIQEDCANQTGVCAPADPQNSPYAQKPHDTTADGNGIRPETKGSRWEHYRLMGTETGFMSGTTPQLLSDPRIENGYPKPTSCITCHYYASVGISQAQTIGPGLTIDRPDVSPKTTLILAGVPTRNALTPVGSAPGAKKYMQSDFNWTILARARSKTDTCR